MIAPNPGVGIPNHINITDPIQTTTKHHKSQTTCDALHILPAAVGFMIGAVNREKWYHIVRITPFIE